MKETALLLVGHGSRESQANREFGELASGYARRHPEFDVTTAFVELVEPDLLSGLREAARTHRRVLVLPLFLFAAGHIKNDLPLAVNQVRQEFPGGEFVIAAELGVHPRMVELARNRLQPVLDEAPLDATELLVMGRGSSDPDANADFCKLVRLLGEGCGVANAQPCFSGITGPKLRAAVEAVLRSRPQRVIILPYLLLDGILLRRMRDEIREFARRHPWIRFDVAPYLGAGEPLFQLLDERIQQALGGRAPLACDNCQFRIPIGRIAGEVGGLRSLLWSLRHSLTHTQAAPHPHAHPPLMKHVLVCGSIDCAARGSLPFITALRREIKAASMERKIRVTRTSCMGRCGEGPTVVVYPDGVWYRGVQEGDAKELVREHLLGDRLVTPLVDNIMQ